MSLYDIVGSKYGIRAIVLLAVIGIVFPLQAQNNYSLKEALWTARLNNPDLKTEHYTIDFAQSDVLTARLRPNPRLNNQTLQQVQSNKFSPDSYWYNSQNRQVWWQLTRQFQLTGQRKYKIDYADKNLKFSADAYAETERRVFSEVAFKWLEVWTAQKQLDIIITTKINIDSLYLINKVRLKDQVITQTDLFRTELLDKQFAIQYKTSKQELLNRQRELQFLLGLKDSVKIDTADIDLIKMPLVLDSLLALSLKHRTDIQAARDMIDVSASNIKYQKSLAFPQPEIGSIWNPQNSVQYVGIFATVDLPIFNRNQGEIKKSYVMKQQSEHQLYAIESRLVTEISTAYASYKTQEENIKSFRAVLSLSENILKNVRYAYLRGGTTIIDFLEAQRSWLETKQQYYEALRLYHQSYIQLLYTTGLINQLAQ